MISSAQIHCDSDHSQNWTLWSVSSPCNYYTICMDDICDVALFITHVTLEVQFHLQSFWPFALDLLSSWQMKTSCYHHQLKLSGVVLLVCLKDSQYPGILKNLTNRTPSRSWYVGVMTVQFFSCLSLAKVRGMQKNSCCLFLNSVHHWCHPLCFILPATEMIKFPMRFTLWNICALDPVALAVCDIFHKIQSSLFFSAVHSLFVIESLSVSKCSLCFDV
jgi:hypothetical protein